MSASRPNLLVIMAEQFSAFSDPNQGEFPVRTPHLERLAARSARFERTYCNDPVCGPSRMSFLTGRYVCNHGAYDNGSQLPSHMPTFAHVLTRGGYQTVMCGRMHMQGLDQKHGFERRLCAEIGNPYLENPGEFPKAYEPVKPPREVPRTTPEPAFSTCPIFRHDEYVTAQATRFLREAPGRGDDRPFCLTVGYLASHGSLHPLPDLEPLYNHYMQQDLPIARFTPDDYARLPEHIQRITYTTRVFDEAWQRHEMALYLARVEYLDRQLGQVLEALDASGLADDTVVLFTADHGEGMGRHGQWGKMFFYEDAERIPLYVRLPGQTDARVVTDRVSLVDVLPSLAEWAGVEVPMPVDGRSIAPLAAGQPDPGREDVVFAEYHGYRSVSDMYMVVKGDWKYCHYLREPGELYNLADDPGENENLIDRPALAPVRADLEAEVRKRVDIEGLADRIRVHNLQRQVVVDALSASPIHAQEALDRIRAHRAAVNEPWWDGGAYCAQWEQHLYAAIDWPFPEAESEA